MRPMSAEMVESFLKKNGFRLVSSKGSHFKWENQATGKWLSTLKFLAYLLFCQGR